MKLPVIIIGAGGHAGVLLDTLCLLGFSVRAISVKQQDSNENSIYGLPLVTDAEILERFRPEQVLLVNGVGSVQVGQGRRKIFESFKAKGYTFATVVHPKAVVSSRATLDEGVQVMAGAVIQTSCKVGANTIINTRASVDHNCTVGEHVHIAPGATLSGSVFVGAGTHIGAGATIIQNINVGMNSLIGAGALVLKDVPAGKTALGVPASIGNLR